jgi:hypothetical protein
MKVTVNVMKVTVNVMKVTVNVITLTLQPYHAPSTISRESNDGKYRGQQGARQTSLSVSSIKTFATAKPRLDTVDCTHDFHRGGRVDTP